MKEVQTKSAKNRLKRQTKGSKTKVGNVPTDNDIAIDKVKTNKEMFRNKFLLWEIKFWKESWK
jgi:hypothetical protein